MSAPIETLERIEQALVDAAPLLGAEAALERRREAARVRRAFAHVDDIVVVGIAGGTGVGKSTLINALAGAAITPAGAIRPTSDRVTVYRHEATQFPTKLPAAQLVLEERRHTCDDLRRVIILDLPDCDSIRTEHRRVMSLVLPETDLLLLVTDPQKYGDRVFYDLLDAAAQAHENKIIILNKTDALAEVYGARCGEVLADVRRDLEAKLRACDHREEVQVLPLSARRAFEAKSAGAPSPTEFQALEDILGELRAEKRRRRIKERNLDAAFERVCARIREDVGDEALEPRLSACREALRAAEDDLREAAHGVCEAAFPARLSSALTSMIARRNAEAWSTPARLLARRLTSRGMTDLPEPGIVNERVKTFLHRVERTGAHAERVFHEHWERPAAGPPPAPAAAWDFGPQLEALAGPPRRRRFVWTVVVVVLIMLLSALRSALQDLCAQIGESASWAAALRDFLLQAAQGLLAELHPFVLLFWALVAAGAYAVAVAGAVFRASHRAERVLAALRESLHTALRDAAAVRLAPLRARMATLEAARDAIRAALAPADR